jgi:hypothetical protein
MLKIERASNGKVVLRLSGAIEGDEVAELDRLIKLENGAHLVLDLENVTRVDREGVRFLGRCVQAGAVLVNSPAYIRDWIAREQIDRPFRLGMRSWFHRQKCGGTLTAARFTDAAVLIRSQYQEGTDRRKFHA